MKINEYVVDFIGVSEYIDMSRTLALSHRLAWFLEPTGVNLRALGVHTVDAKVSHFLVLTRHLSRSNKLIFLQNFIDYRLLIPSRSFMHKISVQSCFYLK